MTVHSKKVHGYLKNGKIDTGWWSDQIKAAIAFRREYAQQQRWPEWRKYYRGKWDLGKVMPSAVFFRMMRTIVPRVYFRNPAISVSAATPGIDNWAFAQLVERVDNKMVRHMGVKKQMKRIVQNTFLFGTGIGKLGFGAQYSPSPNNDTGTQAPITASGHHTEYNSLVFPNMPWFMSTHTGNFLVPAGAANLDSAAWVAELITRPVDELRMDDRYNTKDLKPTKTRTTAFIGTGGQHLQISVPVDMVEMYEIRDKRTKKVFVIIFSDTMNAQEVILGPQDDFLQYENRINYYDSIFNDDDEVFWGVPDSVHLEPHQLESNDIRTAIMYHRRMSMIKLLIRRNAISETELDKLLSSDPMAAIQVDGDPISDVRIAEIADIPTGLMTGMQEVKSEMREDMGFSRNEFGDVSPPNARTTKFESQVAKMASEIRIDERRDQLADLLVEMTRDMHRILFDEWNDEQVVDVIGPEGVQLWIRFKPAMLKGRAYEISVDPDTALPQTRDVREARAERTYELLKDNPLVDPLRLTRFLLHEKHGVQFDDMIRGIPPGTGTLDRPLTIEQYMQMMQAIAAKGVGALPGPGAQQQEASQQQ